VSFRRMKVGEVDQALQAAEPQLPAQNVLDAFATHWESIIGPLRSALDTRMDEKLDAIRNQLEQRKDTEIQDIQAILTELEKSIRKELHEIAPDFQQLRLLLDFSDEEGEQFQRDVNALRARLERIPEEIDQEQEAIRARYSDLKERLFPVAVTFLVPERLG